jgi:hypothetical protein
MSLESLESRLRIWSMLSKSNRPKSSYVSPSHFTHPVTGKSTNEAIRNAPFLKK